MERAGLALHRGGCGPDQWRAMQEALLPDYSLQIWAKECCQQRIFKGKPAPRTLHLYLYDSHFAVITSLAAYLSSSYACDFCCKGFNNKGLHVCAKSCPRCKTPGRCPREGSLLLPGLPPLLPQPAVLRQPQAGDGSRKRKEAHEGRPRLHPPPALPEVPLQDRRHEGQARLRLLQVPRL